MFEHNVSNIQTQCALLYMKSAMKNLLYIYTFGNMGNAYKSRNCERLFYNRRFLQP